VSLEDKNIQARLLQHTDMMEKNEFCVINNAEVAPEICNEFITIYMEARKCGNIAVERSL